MSATTIRPFTPSDYPAVVALWNSIYPENQLTVADLRDRDTRRAAHLRFQRFVVDQNGSLLAYGQYDQRADEYHPQMYVVFVCAAQTTPWPIRHTLGTHLLTTLQPYHPTVVSAIAREDMPNVRLYLELGFVEVGRTYESRFDPARLDRSQVTEAVAVIQHQGYQLYTLCDLAEDPQRDQKLYELVIQLEQDVPRQAQYTPPDFATFQQQVITHPDMLPDAYVIAVHQDTYVGVSSVWQRSGNDYLETDLTGVRREHRQRGLARALKLSALAMITQRQQTVKTWNDAHNQPILTLNTQVGFVRQPAWIDYVKRMTNDRGTAQRTL